MDKTNRKGCLAVFVAFVANGDYSRGIREFAGSLWVDTRVRKRTFVSLINILAILLLDLSCRKTKNA